MTPKKWLNYDGRLWNPATGEAESIRLACLVVRNIFIEAQEISDKNLKKKIQCWAHQSEAEARIIAMRKFARAISPVAIYSDDFDKNLYLLNCMNGTIDLKTGVLLAHDPTNLITKITNVDYDPNAQCPLWMNCMSTWMSGDTKMIDYLQRLGGMCLTGDISSRVFVIFHGPGKNGKSVFADTLLEILGDYATIAHETLLEYSKYDRHPTEIADLWGKRLIIASETR